MKNVIVIYKSKYGFTKKYAEWIAQELNADIQDVVYTKTTDLKDYDIIIFGGGLYANSVNGISLLTKSFPTIQGKSLYLFTVGVADVTKEENTVHIRTGLNKVLTPEMQKKFRIFYFRGGIDYQRLNFIHRTMMAMLLHVMKKKPKNEQNDEEKIMLETYGQKVDFSEKETITPLIEEIKSLSRQS